MATHKSALKRHRQSIKRRDHNRSIRAAVRTSVKNTKAAVLKGDKKAAMAALKEAEKALARAAGKGKLHKRNASRRISRLSKLVASSTK